MFSNNTKYKIIQWVTKVLAYKPPPIEVYIGEKAKVEDVIVNRAVPTIKLMDDGSFKEYTIKQLTWELGHYLLQHYLLHNGLVEEEVAKVDRDPLNTTMISLKMKAVRTLKND
jgi:hypothetical protein